MQILQLQIAGAQIRLQFYVVVRTVAVVVALVNHKLPLLAVLRRIDAVLVVNVVGAVVLHGLVVVIVELYRLHRLHIAQVHLYPFSRIAGFGRPERAHALVGEVCGRINAVGTRYLHLLAQRKKHPAGETVCGVLDVAVGIPVRIVAESGGAIHNAVRVECRGVKPYPALELVFQRKHAGRHVPIVASHVAESAAMTAALNESARLVAHRVVLLVNERPQRRVADIHTVGINLEFRSRSTVLKIVFSVVFCHRRPFGERRKRRPVVVVVHAETLPAVFVRTEHQHVMDFTDRIKVVAAQLHGFQRILIA